MEQKKRIVKIVHFIMMIVWPVLWPILLFADIAVTELEIDAFRRFQTYGFLLIFMWLMYSHFMLSIIRNYNLQSLVSEYCDFEGYLECMKYLEKFYFSKRGRLSQRISCTDAYLVKGDFDAAYANLMEIKPEYQKLGLRTQMTYDYFWCRFYADLEDVENYKICLKVFQDRWLQQGKNSARITRHAVFIMQELIFRLTILDGNSVSARNYLNQMYKNGKLVNKYDFIKYCYYRGKIEYISENLMLAKHWFAQTVSFGLQEHMSRNASKLLEKLDEMHVPYALNPPEQNQFYGRTGGMRMMPGFLSILLSFIILMMILF